MSASWRRLFRNRRPVVASTVVSALVLFASVSQAESQADTDKLAPDEALPAEVAANPEVSLWVDAAPLGLVIRQLANLSGRSAEIQEVVETGDVARAWVAQSDAKAEADDLVGIEGRTEIKEFADVPVSGRFSGSLNSTLVKLAADYPVVFDLDDKTLRATSSVARASVSTAMLSPTLDEKFMGELLASSAAGNKVEFREDALHVSGHPGFVKRQTVLINKAIANAGVALNSDAQSKAIESVSSVATVMADAGSAEVLVDIQDEDKLPVEQANLSKPIRWVTDIPGYNTF